MEDPDLGAVDLPSRMQLEFTVGGQTYRIQKERSWLTHGRHSATPIPVVRHDVTFERDLNSGDVVVVNWGLVAVVRVVKDD